MIITQDLLNKLPQPWPQSLLTDIKDQVKKVGKKLIILDDDPTGTQTVHHVPVLTEWDTELLENLFSESDEIVYILTNTRSFSLPIAQSLNREIAKNLTYASQKTGRDFEIVSRSDSTLRGHYPGELDALIEALGRKFDGILLIPFFKEGGRLTINDIHYVAEDQTLIPVAETEFATDPVFGYHNSDLKYWICEKNENRIDPSLVASISIEDERLKGPEWIATKLTKLSNRRVCVVNAAVYRDLEVFVLGLLKAELSGKSFIYRSAASFVPVRGGLFPQPLITSSDLGIIRSMNGGLIIAGSYIRKSTLQIEAVQKLSYVKSIEVSVKKLLDSNECIGEINRVSNEMNRFIGSGLHTLIYTSRQLGWSDSKGSAIVISQQVSEALVKIVRNLEEKPAWIIAKGGITSSDIATKGLDVKRAEVLGQAIPGVPIWCVGAGSKWPGLIYVVFPGNVGNNDSIVEMINILTGHREKDHY